MKILIAGDSFAADWKIKYNGNGWVNMLSEDYEVTNIAQAGVSEYKIYQQLIKHDTTKYDKIIISHTSAYRIPVVKHPIHSKDILHSNCDLIYLILRNSLYFLFIAITSVLIGDAMGSFEGCGTTDGVGFLSYFNLSNCSN
jgi:hypothetical protein